MPGFDGTGPGGMGPMTGGARGFCNPSGVAYGGYRGYGHGYPGWGGGAGWTMPYGWGYNRFANPWYGGGYGYPYGGYGYGGWNAPYGMYGYPYRPLYGFGRGLGPCGMGMAWGRRGGWGRGRW